MTYKFERTLDNDFDMPFISNLSNFMQNKHFGDIGPFCSKLMTLVYPKKRTIEVLNDVFNYLFNQS